MPELTTGSGISSSYNGATDKTTWTITITAVQTAALDPTIINPADDALFAKENPDDVADEPGGPDVAGAVFCAAGQYHLGVCA